MKQENLSKVVKLRHELHRHPELSMEETFTKEHLMEFVEENTNLEIVNKGRWFYVYKKGSHSTMSPIAFRADFDAVAIKETCDIPHVSLIEGVGHKCGHDGHSSVLAGLILELEKIQTKTDIYFIFQHAEETGQGGEECASLISEKGIKEIYAFHNRSGFERHTIVYRRGLTQCASKGLTIHMEGKPSHASQPEDGINPAYAIAELIQYSKELVESDRFKEMVLCSIIHSLVGQPNFGICASVGEVSMTLRANREDELNELEMALRNRAEELGREQQMKVSFHVSDPFPETRNHDEAIDMVLKVAEKMNLKTLEMSQPWRASEDFGYYTKQCNGAMIYVGNGMDYPMVHTSDYDFCDDIISTCVDLFYNIAMEERE